MLKLYISYFIVGLFLSWMILFIWGFSAGAEGIWPYVSLFSSFSLFCVASVISLYKPKIGAVVGMINIIGISPFVWNMIKDLGKGGINWVMVIICGLLIWYVLSFVYSLIIVSNKKYIVASKINRYLLTGLSIIPPGLFIYWISAMFIRF